MCPAQGHNAVTLVRLEPAAPLSHFKHSTTEPLRSPDSLELSLVAFTKYGYREHSGKLSKES